MRTLALHQWRRNKGSFLGFGAIILIAACMLDSALTLLCTVGPRYTALADELHTADVDIVVPRTAATADVRDVIDRGIASGEFYDCDSPVLALGYIGMTLGSYRWLRPQGRRTAQEIAVEFSTALLRGLIRDETVREVSPLGVDVSAAEAAT